MIKIVYFDEGSATDYLTIKNGGTLIIKTDKTKQSKNEEKVEIGGKVQSLFNFLFLKGDAGIKGNINASHLGESLIKTSISNSILSDFLDILSTKETDCKIQKLEKYSVVAVQNSIAYFQTLTPYFSMTDGNIQVAEGFALQMSKMHETLKSTKGYYELLAINNINKKKQIFRFNNQAFKNNYGIVDLTQMKLAFYGIEVGILKESELDFTNAFKDGDIMTNINGNNETEEDKELPVFDIILAGVE